MATPAGRTAARSPLRLLLAILAMLLLLSACSSAAAPAPRTSIDIGGNGAPAEGVDATSPGAADPASRSHPLPGRLAISQGTDALITMKPDGTDRTEAARVEAGESLVQPVFSPDGSQLAWVRADVASQTTQVVIGAPDGSAPHPFDTGDVAAFFLSWDPTSSRIGVLGNGPDAMRFEVLEPTGDLTAVAQGQPFYLAWAPDGQRMLVHIGNTQLEELSLRGTATKPTRADIGDFSAPAWSADGATQVYAISTGGGQDESGNPQALVARRDGKEQRILEYLGEARFVLAPDGGAVAIRTPPVRGKQGSGGLFVVDTRSGSAAVITRDPAVAFSWSPDGTALAFLTPVSTPQGVLARWNVWREGAGISSYALHTPSQLFGQLYLPFFDQYAQGMSMWSPDSSAFAYAGVQGEGTGSGIWIQRLEDPGETPASPVRISDGDVVTWGTTAT